jgi:YVTN family beta-propeller protein
MIANGDDIYLVVVDSIVKIDANTNTEVDRQDLGVFPSGLAVTDGKLYVGTIGPDNVEVLDADTLDPITTIPGFAVPVKPAVIDGLVYYPQQGANDVLVIDPATDTVVDTIPSLAANGGYGIDGMIYVMGLGTSGIDVVDPVAGASVATIPVGDIPIGMVAIGREAWVTNAADNSISKVDLDTNTTIGAAFPVAGNPRRIVEFEDALYYTSNEDALLQGIDPANNALGFTLQFAGGADAEIGALVVVGDSMYVGGSQTIFEVALCASPPSTSTTVPGSSSTPTAQPARAVTGTTPSFTG